MLTCVSKYTSSLGSFQPGDIISAPDLCLALLADSPLSFRQHDQGEEVKQSTDQLDTVAIEAPGQHRAIKRSKKNEP